MKKLVQKAQFFGAFVKLVDDPNKTENIFRMSEIALKNKNNPSAQAFLDTVSRQSGFRKLYENSYFPQAITQAELLAFPEGTLGRAYGNFLKDNNLAMDFYPEITPTGALDYLTLRMRQTHDLFHVLTGFGTSLDDEIALQAFLVAQTGSAFSGMLIVAAMLHTLKKYPTRLMALMSAITSGFKLGQRSTFLLGVPWETLWAEPLQELVLKYVFDDGQSDSVKINGGQIN